MKIIVSKLTSLVLSSVLLLTTGFVTSCQKTVLNKDENTGLLKEPSANKMADHATVAVEAYNAVVFDSCRNENVLLNGQAQYKLIESFDNGYYINYEIKLEQVTGIGENTGTVYHGGGKIVGITKLNEDGSNITSKVTYKVKYEGTNGNRLTFIESSKFVMKNNVTKVEFSDIFDSCK